MYLLETGCHSSVVDHEWGMLSKSVIDSAALGAKKSSIVNEGARATLEQNWTGSLGSSGVLRDRNDLKLLTGCTYYIPNSFAHQKPCHWGYEGN